MDVQLVPEWTLEPDSSRVECVSLNEEQVMAALGRAFNAKEPARRWVCRSPDPPDLLRLGPALAIARAECGEQARAAVELAIPGVSEWSVEALTGPRGPRGGFRGAPIEWWPHIEHAPESSFWGLAACSVVRPTLERIVASFPIKVGVEPTPAGTLALAVPEGAAPEIDPRGVGREAARSLLDPGDVTRLELERVLYALTGLWASEGPAADP